MAGSISSFDWESKRGFYHLIFLLVITSCIAIFYILYTKQFSGVTFSSFFRICHSKICRWLKLIFCTIFNHYISERKYQLICGEIWTYMLVLRMGIQFYAVLQPSDLWPDEQSNKKLWSWKCAADNAAGRLDQMLDDEFCQSLIQKLWHICQIILLHMMK